MLDLIKTRRSIRRFKPEPIEDETIYKIIEAGTWAPSGKNNQPWKFVVIKDKTIKEKIAQYTIYSRTISNSAVCVVVFLDYELSYDRTKDVQAVGACIQNMLLAAHYLSLGGVWLGEILKNKDKVKSELEVPENFELMAVVALGYPDEKPKAPYRMGLDEVVFRIA